MFRTISTRLRVSFVTFFLLIAAGAAATYALSAPQAETEAALHVATRAQMLVAKTSRDVLVFAKLPDGERRLAQRDAVLEDIKAFETSLSAMREGGAAPLDLASTRMKELPAVSAADAQEKLARVTELWETYADYARGVVDSDGEDATALVNVLSREAEIIDTLADTADILRDDTDTRNRNLLALQIVLLLAGVALLAVVLWATWNHVNRPLRALVRAAEDISTGSVETPVDVQGPQEIEELAESFERMRLSVAAILDSSGAGDDLDDLDDLD